MLAININYLKLKFQEFTYSCFECLGNILYEIQAAQVANARLCVSSGKCSRALMKKRLGKTLEILEEAIHIFNIHYPTRLLAQSARETTLKELQDWMRSL